ncbi:MAG TPA: metalloregulator ArsR/SmtB family transcription factor [Rhizomicrobium sp.]
MVKPRSHAAQFRTVLHLLAILGEPIRVVILQRLAKAPTTAGDLAKHLPVSRTAVVQHLKRMESAGLVAATAEGRRRLYRLAPKGFEPLAAWLQRIA